MPINMLRTRMNSFPLQTIKNQQYFSKNVVLDESFILLDSSLPFTDTLRKALMEWNFKVVYSEGEFRGASDPVESSSGPRIPSAAAPSHSDRKVPHIDPNSFEEVSFEDGEFVVENQGSGHSSSANIPPAPSKAEAGDGINSNVKKILENAHNAIGKNNDQSRMEVVQNVYNEYLNYTNALYTHYATHKELNLQEISDTIKDLCMFIHDNRRYVLRIQPTEKAGRNFLVTHSMRTTVLAITIGLQLRMPLTKLVELGVTGILHEIGQTRLPPQLYITDKMLSAPEKAKLATHPVLGYNILQEKDFPVSIALGVLEHHERENGQGYPRHLSGNQISLYAKIISVACSFEAITAPRHFREAKTTYDAMLEMLRNEQHAYDDTVIKALLYSLSLFPIGAYVYLANGRIAQVTDANPNDPKNPIIQIIGQKDEKGNPVVLQSGTDKYKIVRVLNKQEANDILKALK